MNNDELHNLVAKNCTPKNAIPGDKGKIKNFPLWLRKQIYDYIKQIDFDEIDEMLKDPDAGAISCTEFKGLNITIGKDKIFVFIKVGFYNMDEKEMQEDKVLCLNIPRDELEDLIKE